MNFIVMCADEPRSFSSGSPAAKQAYPCYVQDLPITPHRDRLDP